MTTHNLYFCHFHKTCCGFYLADNNCRQREGGDCPIYVDNVNMLEHKMKLKQYEEEDIQRELAEGDCYLTQILNSPNLDTSWSGD